MPQDPEIFDQFGPAKRGLFRSIEMTGCDEIGLSNSMSSASALGQSDPSATRENAESKALKFEAVILVGQIDGDLHEEAYLWMFRNPAIVH